MSINFPQIQRSSAVTIALALMLLILSGCSATSSISGADGASASRLLLGKNAVGEACFATRSNGGELSQSVHAFDIFCGDWRYPSVRAFVVNGSGRNIRDWSEDTAWVALRRARMSGCAAADALEMLDDLSAILLKCQLKNGGWPYIALAAGMPDGDVVLADGIPAALPPLERLIGHLAGKLQLRTLDGGEDLASTAASLESALRDRPYGAGDMRQYFELMTLGGHHNKLKNYAKAELAYKEALLVHAKNLGAGHPGSLDPIMHIALELSNQEKTDEADAYFERARSLVGFADEADSARLTSYLAYHEANRHNFPEALRLAAAATSERQQALASLRGEANDDLISSSGQVQAAETVQSVYLEAGLIRRDDPQESLRLIGSMDDTLKNNPDAPAIWLPQVERLAALVNTEQGQYDSARSELQAALVHLQAQVPETRHIALANLQYGDLSARSGRTDEAIQHYLVAIETLRARGDAVRLRQIQGFLDTVIQQPSPDAQLLNAAFSATQLVQSASTVFELSRAATRLASSATGSRAVIRDLQDAEDIRSLKEDEYQGILDAVVNDGGYDRLKAITAELVAINRRIAELEKEVQAAMPGYQHLLYRPVGFDELTNVLGEREAVVQVMPSTHGTYVVWVSRGAVKIVLSTLDADAVTERVSDLRRAFEVGAQGLRPYDVDAAHRFFKDLFGDLAEEIISREHVVFVSSGALLGFPPSLFVTQSAGPIQNYDYSDVSWLGQQVSLSVSPSVRSFWQLRSGAKPSDAPRPFLGFGGFTASAGATDASGDQARTSRGRPSLPLSSDCLVSQASRARYEEAIFSLPDLPGTEKEVKAVASMFGAGPNEVFLGEAFSKRRVTQKGTNLADYRVLYFATHALLPDEVDCQSEPALLTSLGEAQGDTLDPFLSSSDMRNLRLNADLVVLSGCNTGGAGIDGAGESLSGLTRSFFFAGARTLLVSHWSIDDESTAELMSTLFATMRDAPSNETVASALKTAQTKILQSATYGGPSWRSHPIFWAPFTVVGDGARSVISL